MAMIDFSDIERAVGRITIYFNSLEYRLASLIHYLIDDKDSDVGEIITSQLSFHQLIATLYSLFRLKFESKEKINKLDDILKRAETVSVKRNDCVHSLWLKLKDDTYIRSKITSKYKKRLKFKSQIITDIDDINKIAEEIHDINSELYQIEINWTI